MPDASGPDRHFSEKEVGAILKRASELQESRRTEAAEGGLSRSELEQIAAEMGIDPGHISAAMAEMESSPPATFGARLLGGSTVIDVEREVDGVLDPDDWEAVAAEIRKAFWQLGTSSQVGQSLQWTYHSRHEQKLVTLTPHEGRTRIRVHSRFGKTALRIFLPMMIVGFVVSLNLLIALRLSVGGLAFVAGLVGLVFLTARAIFKRLSSAEQTRINLLIGEIEGRLRTPPGRPTNRAASPEKRTPAGDAPGKNAIGDGLDEDPLGGDRVADARRRNRTR